MGTTGKRYMTAEVARLLNVKPYRLLYAIGIGNLKPPAKDQCGNYWWSESEVELARQVLTRKRGRPRKAEKETAHVG